MIRVVMDTNVLVSAMISLSGNEALLLLAVKQGLLRPCFSRAVLEEYSEVLARPKFAFSPDEIAALVDLLQHQGDLLRPAPLSGISPDPKDDKFIACALTARGGFCGHGEQEGFPERPTWTDPGRQRRGTPESDHPRTLAKQPLRPR